LAKQDDAAKVISIVGRQAFQLFANGHNANGIARPRWTADGLFESLLVAGDGSRLLIAMEETLD
jgi:hypothetical protein